MNRYQQQDVSIGQFLVDNIKNMTTPRPTTSTFTGVTHAGNWPVSAVFAIEYKCFDRQFPQVDHERTVAYFDDVAAVLRWLAHKREWIAGTDYDFSMDYRVYVWDWGPVFKYAKRM